MFCQKEAMDSESPIVNIREELDKMGLTNSSQHAAQQRLTSRFYEMWEKTVQGAESTRHVLNKTSLSEGHPAAALNPHEICRMQDDQGAKNDNTRRPIDLLPVFDKHRPVLAVLATNSTMLRFKMKTGATTSIDHNDVDCQGKLIQNKLAIIDQSELTDGVRENVEIRFFFF
jgi:hypothetical protein